MTRPVWECCTNRSMRVGPASRKTYLAHALQVLLRVRRVDETEPQKVLNFCYCNRPERRYHSHPVLTESCASPSNFCVNRLNSRYAVPLIRRVNHLLRS